MLSVESHSIKGKRIKVEVYNSNPKTKTLSTENVACKQILNLSFESNKFSLKERLVENDNIADELLSSAFPDHMERAIATGMERFFYYKGIEKSDNIGVLKPITPSSWSCYLHSYNPY